MESRFLRFVNLWTVGTIALYYFGSISWVGRASINVGAYTLGCLLAYNIGFRLAVPRSSMPRFEGLVPANALVARLVVSAYALASLWYLYEITGRNATQLDSYSLDFGAVYAAYQEAIKSLDVTSMLGAVILLKGVLFPLALAIVVSRFRRDRILLFIFSVPFLLSSLFRGTDFETIDLAVTFIVCMWLYGRLSRARVFVIAVITIGTLELFLLRRISRFGGSLPSCLPDGGACFNFQSATATHLGAQFGILKVFLTNYVTNGYQGLDYAFRFPWTPNWGFGHLPALGQTVCSRFGTCPSSNYSTVLTEAGWDAQNRWTSAYTVLANDLSWWLVPVWMLLLGMVSRQMLSNWRECQDPLAGAGLVMVSLFWVYSSANMHIGLTLDLSLATVCFIYAYPVLILLRRSSRGGVHEGA